jgi:hypothetical protein
MVGFASFNNEKVNGIEFETCLQELGKIMDSTNWYSLSS